MGAFRKKHSQKVRVIHDLSWPPGSSINSHLEEQVCTLQYITIDDAVQHVRQYGKGTLMAKLDLKDAFKHVVVNPQYWHLLGTTWKTEQGTLQYYVDLVLPFGLRSSPHLFDQFAKGLEYIMKVKGVNNVEHYLDDFFTCGPPNSQICYDNLNLMCTTCKETGFQVNPQKIVQPTTQLEFLGIVIDSDKLQLKISAERLCDIYVELLSWQKRMSCKKRELLSLIGKLTFVSRVVKSGRTFVRRMIDQAKRVKYLHYKVKLNKAIREDIKWWLAYLPVWNGVSAFQDEKWCTNFDIKLYTDSSDLGIGAVFNNEWFYEQFSHTQQGGKLKSINWRELYAIVKALSTWGIKFCDKRILIYCDNEAVTYIVNSGTSKNQEIMKLVRAMFYITAQHNIDIKCCHLPGIENTSADALSRIQISKFLEENLNANLQMTTPINFCYEDC